MQKSTSILTSNFLQFIGISTFISFGYLTIKLQDGPISGYIFFTIFGIILMGIGCAMEMRLTPILGMMIKKITLLVIIFWSLLFISEDIIKNGVNNLFGDFGSNILILPLMYCIFLLSSEQNPKQILSHLLLIISCTICFILPSLHYAENFTINETKLTYDNGNYYPDVIEDGKNIKPGRNKSEECLSAGGQWSREFSECFGIDAATCENIGGKFNECASACRHTKQEICTLQCVQVCEIK